MCFEDNVVWSEDLSIVILKGFYASGQKKHNISHTSEGCYLVSDSVQLFLYDLSLWTWNTFLKQLWKSAISPTANFVSSCTPLLIELLLCSWANGWQERNSTYRGIYSQGCTPWEFPSNTAVYHCNVSSWRVAHIEISSGMANSYSLSWRQESNASRKGHDPRS